MMKTLVAGVLVLVFSAMGAVAQETRVITTSGIGTVEAPPDLATIRIGVTHEARIASEALDMTSDSMRRILARLSDQGIEARDMQTSGLSLQPVWSRSANTPNEPRKITGFVARNGLSLRVRNLGDLGAILDTVVQDGANTFEGLSFSIADTDAAMEKARAEAVKTAMRKAQQLAQAAGITLGPIQSISESGGAPRPVMMEMATARMASDVPVATGEVSLSAQVTMVFSIAE